MKTKKLAMTMVIATIFSVAILFTISSCKEDAVSQANNLNFSSVRSSDGLVIQSLQLKEAKILIRDIRLEKEGDPSANPLGFIVGPYVLTLNANTGVHLIGAGVIPAGKYSAVRFNIHPLDQNMSMSKEFAVFSGGLSVVINGVYSGTDFTYKTDVSAEQDITLKDALFVDDYGNTNITLKAWPVRWFVYDGRIMNPIEPSSKQIIDDNITRDLNHVFEAFTDKDMNGEPD